MKKLYVGAVALGILLIWHLTQAQNEREFSIQAGAAVDTLNEWSKQANFQIGFDYNSMLRQTTHRVCGVMSRDDALHTMMVGTHLAFDYVNERVLAVFTTRKIHRWKPVTPICKPWMGAAAPLPPCRPAGRTA